MNPFAFLATEWPEIHEASTRAAAAAYPEPRTACFYARRALELLVAWTYQHDRSLRSPYDASLGALLHEPTWKALAGEIIFVKARVIHVLGNQAVHGHGAIRAEDAVGAVRELFHVGYWLARTYGRKTTLDPTLGFDPAVLPRTPPLAKQTVEQLRRLETELRASDQKLAAAVTDCAALAAAVTDCAALAAALTDRPALAAALTDRPALDSELEDLRREIAAFKKAAAERPDTHDYSEAETRDLFLDVLLREAGWPLDQKRDREFPVEGLPTATARQDGRGAVDYVLWGDDGKPLALLEAKRTRKSWQAGQQQAVLYADALEKRFGQRPILFLSNGYEHRLWDDRVDPPRAVQGFYNREELERTIQRRTRAKPLAEVEIDSKIVDRYYQTRAIRRIAESFERDRDRKALLVMATGAGKTRTVVALADLLMRASWAKRVLFLADRVALVRQAVNAFKRHLPDASPVNLVDEPTSDGRVYVSTYPTMMNRIDERVGGVARFGVGYFDLVVIDEAHRSVFERYKSLLAYFDARLVGLTATPAKEIHRNTYRLFDLEDGVPTDAYALPDAVADGFLVPPLVISVPLKFPTEGISYDDLSDDERDAWDELEWDDLGQVPSRVDAGAVNQWLFNRDTVDKVLAHLMARGQKVAGGDRLAKTILFARNQDHARFIAERFDANYPHWKGHFARVVTHETEYAQTLIDDFATREKMPHLAISVDMLDTGIDIPEVANLVFFKPVRSKIKFWQMLGRGTRLCPDLFGPGQAKTFFTIFDYCQNFESFGEHPERLEGKTSRSLGHVLFEARLALLAALDSQLSAPYEGDTVSESTQIEAQANRIHPDYETLASVRHRFASDLHAEVAAMNLDNFLIRPHRRAVEKFARPEAWRRLDPESHDELACEVAGLPSTLPPEPEIAKRFDLLVLRIEREVLSGAHAGVERGRAVIVELAEGLEAKLAIPKVAAQLELIREIQTADWWTDVRVPTLERMRRRLRDLVGFVDRPRRFRVYTDFEDEIGSETRHQFLPLALREELDDFDDFDDFERFRAKARAFLRAHEDHLAIHKLRMNKPLNALDLEELGRMLVQAGVGTEAEVRHAALTSRGLGLFVRSLIGLDRGAAKEALAGFVAANALGANQIELVSLIVDHLTERGAVEPARLYESPFTDLAPRGLDALFDATQVAELLAALETVRERALAA